MASKTKPIPPDVQKLWDNFWAPIVAPKGRINRKQLMLELADYSMVMDGAAKVYDHITGGRISKVNTDPNVVIAVATDVENETLEQVLRDEKEAWFSNSDPGAVLDTCHVSVRPMTTNVWFVRAILPDKGTFRCTYMADPDVLVPLNTDGEIPEDWKDTVLEAVKELLKED